MTGSRSTSSLRAPAKKSPVLLSWLSLLVALLLVSAWTVVASAPSERTPDLPDYPWLYLRGGQALDPGEQVVEVLEVGDVMPGRAVAGEPQPLSGVAPWLRTADLAVGNLECVVAEGGTARPGPYRLRAPASAAAVLSDAGLDVLGLANNHALDFGAGALAETASRLEGARIAAVGAGPDAQAAAQPVIREVGGLRLAFLAFNAVPDPEDDAQEGGWTPARWDPARAMAAVAAARSQADAVIVSVHWGYEYELNVDPFQRRAAQTLLDAGADLVIGHHPHVVQATEAEYPSMVGTSEASRGGFVAFSLGNLLFDQQQGETQQGLALRAFFDRHGLRAVQALPVWAGPQPRLMSSDEAASLLARVEPPDRRLGFACRLTSQPGSEEACGPVDVPQTPQNGRFRAGEIDLTGDGIPEQVQLVNEQVVVYQDGVEVWRGLPGWQVVDLALGDPNDDGRGEMLLALWKQDAGGLRGSHPFLVGYREGAYRILWGGSAVADPLREAEIGDVDGDGLQELLVLEEQGRNQDVAVWRWHGWGFSLEWRSPSGAYRDLGLLPQEGGPPLVSVGVPAAGH
jgi:hypothetical protein